MRWLKRAAIALFLFVVVLAVVVFGVRLYFNQVGNRELDRTTARLDREEAGWTLEAIELARAGGDPAAGSELSADRTQGRGAHLFRAKQGMEHLAEFRTGDVSGRFAAPP